MSKSDYDRAAERVIAEHPGVRLEVERTSRHTKVWVIWRGLRRLVVRPSTPSDFRGPKKHACDIKRALREMGAA